MKRANEQACEVLFYPNDPKYAENIRLYQGCPTVAATKGGRLYLGWYAGGTTEPHIDNYNWLVYSDDGGKTLSDPILVIPSDRERMVHALDIQLWTDPDGRLHVFWMQDDARVLPENPPVQTVWTRATVTDGILFDDCTHALWEMVCDDPDAVRPAFSTPRCISTGFLRCKPLVLSDGTWLYFNYDQLNRRYGYSISRDKGVTLTRRYGADKHEVLFDEGMAYERRDGSVRMFARTHTGELAETRSYDKGFSWTPTVSSGIDTPNTRFFVSRTPSGRVMLINNDDRKDRKNLTVYLSDDDGDTWAYKCCVDSRVKISYPDADFYGDKIYLIYDRERTGAREILLTAFDEADVINGTIPTPWVISKP